jgi:hypothetical protein
MAEKVFVSPGVYTSEKDLTFVTRQVGVTTLGLVGETTKGPAFQPIFVSNYGEFQSFFGGLNNTLVNSPVDGNGAPQYELPYIAKSYLSQSNQLFVTRVLGFSGYDAGQAWGITLDAALDPSTVTATTTSFNPYIDYTASTAGIVSNVNIYDALLNASYNSGAVNLSFLGSVGSGYSTTISLPYVKNGLLFTGASFGIVVTSAGQIPYVLSASTSGVTSGPTASASIITVYHNTATTLNTYVSSNPYIQNYIDQFGVLPFSVAFSPIPSAVSAYTPTSAQFINFTGTSAIYSAFSLTYKTVSSANTVPNTVYTISGVVTTYSAASAPVYITGTTSGYTTYEVGTGYADVEDKTVALLRSRGKVDSTTQLPVFQVGTAANLIFDPTVTGATTDPLGDFSLSGYSVTQGNFDYSCSFDKTMRNYLPKVLGRGAQDGKTAIFVEELYDHMFKSYNAAGKIRGINLTPIYYNREFYNYLNEYQPAVTPYVVSELRGNKLLRLFRMWTISDGNAANEQFKISILNIRPDSKEFDIHVRGFYDNDAQPNVLESFSRCTMDPVSNNYIGRKIGTLDGTYASKSNYILVELDDTVDTSDAFPAGFIGFPIRDYTLNSNTGVQEPHIMYKQTYGTFENKRKYYLGLSDTVGIDADFFDYKGVPNGKSYDQWTGLTHGFHMDVDVTGATIDGVKVVINSTGGTYSPIFLFDTGNWQFRTDSGLANGPYEKVYARKFTFVPYGGFDGWDVYRTRRTNLDSFIINGTKGQAGLASGTFVNRTLSNGDLGINSDYYAYLEAIWTFKNPEATNINVFATPGIDTFDNTNLVEASIEMIEQDRADSLYIVTTPDTDPAGDVLTVGDVTDSLADMYDSNYTATYWPWIQILDAENNVYIYVPPTRDVVRNIALTDNIAFPWFAVAGIQRGDVDAIKARKKLTLGERDVLYENRINPIATFTSDGIKIWGNKTLQVKETALNRINVRRLLLQARKLISAVSIRLLFEQNDTIVRNQFLSLVNPILDNIRTERGLYDFRVVLSNDPEDIDRNQLTGKIYLKPTRALEFIVVEFNIMNTGASFDNI